MRIRICAAALALGSLVGRVEAQAPEERRQIDALRDTLQLVTDTMSLREREALLLKVALRSRDEPFYHLYLGTLALRQGELGGVAHLDESAAEFRWATRLSPTWTYAWFGAGSAEFALGDRLAVGGSRDARRQELARDAYRRGGLAMARAVSLEPGFASRLVVMARRAIREGFREQAAALRAALQQAAGDRNGQVWLALGRVQRQLGDSAALNTFARYLGTGRHRALGLVELGRTQLLLGDLSGAMRYLAASAESDSSALRELRTDLEPIASDAELQEFDRRSGAHRLEFLRRFWTTRDRMSLRSDGERLAEHLRRLAVASQEFLVLQPDGSERLDDRGRIFVRHGEPDDRAGYSIPGIEPNESWCYRGAPDSSLVLHFAARPSLHEFRLIESLQDLVDGRFAGSGPRRPDPALFRSRSSIDPLYREIPEGKKALASYLARERSLGRRGMQLATRFDSYRLGFGFEPRGWSGVLVAGSTAASPILQVGFSLAPGSDDSGEEPGQAAVRLRFVALDTLGTVLASVDTVVRGKHPPSAGGLTGTLAIPVRPGRLIVHGAVQTNADEGIDAGIDTITVPSPGGGELALGSLLIGSGEYGVPFSMADGAEFLVMPGGSVAGNGSIRLGVDVFGLPPDAKASVRVQVAPAGRPDAWRDFPERLARSTLVRMPGSGPVASWRVVLPARALRPGAWRIAVEVTSNRRVVRRTADLAVGNR